MNLDGRLFALEIAVYNIFRRLSEEDRKVVGEELKRVNAQIQRDFKSKAFREGFESTSSFLFGLVDDQPPVTVKHGT